MGHTFAMYCHLLPISLGNISASVDVTTSFADKLPLAFAEERVCKLLRLSDKLPLSLVPSIDMTHHAIVFQYVTGTDSFER